MLLARHFLSKTRPNHALCPSYPYKRSVPLKRTLIRTTRCDSMRHYLNNLHGKYGIWIVYMAQNDTIRTPSLKVGKDEVAGSNPAISSIKPVRNDWFSYAFGRFLQDSRYELAKTGDLVPKTGVKITFQITFRTLFGIFHLLYMPKKCNHMSCHMPWAFDRP